MFHHVYISIVTEAIKWKPYSFFSSNDLVLETQTPVLQFKGMAPWELATYQITLHQFSSQVVKQKHLFVFISNSDLDPTYSKCNPKVCEHMSMLHSKFYPST